MVKFENHTVPAALPTTANDTTAADKINVHNVVMATVISRADFKELCTEVKVPCLITKNNSEDGVILAAYQFMFDNGNAVLIQFRETPGFVVGEACLYQSIGGRAQVTLAQPVDSDTIAELNAAKQEFLPQMFAN